MNDNRPEAEHARQVAKARQHLAVVAKGLVELLGPADAAGVMLGAGAAILVASFGDDVAVQALRELAAVHEHEPPAPASPAGGLQ